MTAHTNKKHFCEGLDLIFSRWAAFRMAVEMSWGGQGSSNKAEEFKQALVEYFERGS